jgi:hypothetical protein
MSSPIDNYITEAIWDRDLEVKFERLRTGGIKLIFTGELNSENVGEVSEGMEELALDIEKKFDISVITNYNPKLKLD